jgi:hypothetical protein
LASSIDTVNASTITTVAAIAAPTPRITAPIINSGLAHKEVLYASYATFADIVAPASSFVLLDFTDFTIVEVSSSPISLSFSAFSYPVAANSNT